MVFFINIALLNIFRIVKNAYIGLGFDGSHPITYWYHARTINSRKREVNVREIMIHAESLKHEKGDKYSNVQILQFSSRRCGNVEPVVCVRWEACTKHVYPNELI